MNRLDYLKAQREWDNQTPGESQECCIECDTPDIDSEWRGDTDYICSNCLDYKADCLMDAMKYPY